MSRAPQVDQNKALFEKLQKHNDYQGLNKIGYKEFSEIAKEMANKSSEYIFRFENSIPAPITIDDILTNQSASAKQALKLISEAALRAQEASDTASVRSDDGGAAASAAVSDHDVRTAVIEAAQALRRSVASPDVGLVSPEIGAQFASSFRNNGNGSTRSLEDDQSVLSLSGVGLDVDESVLSESDEAQSVRSSDDNTASAVANSRSVGRSGREDSASLNDRLNQILTILSDMRLGSKLVSTDDLDKIKRLLGEIGEQNSFQNAQINVLTDTVKRIEGYVKVGRGPAGSTAAAAAAPDSDLGNINIQITAELESLKSGIWEIKNNLARPPVVSGTDSIRLLDALAELRATNKEIKERLDAEMPAPGATKENWVNGRRNVDHKYLRDNDHLENGEEFLVKEIKGQAVGWQQLFDADGKDMHHPDGTLAYFGHSGIEQYEHSGVSVFVYQDLNEFSRQVDGATKKRWEEEDTGKILTSIARIEGKAGYIVVADSARGTAKTFISDEEFGVMERAAAETYKDALQATVNLEVMKNLKERLEKNEPEVSDDARSVISEDVKSTRSDDGGAIAILNKMIEGVVEALNPESNQTALERSEAMKEFNAQFDKEFTESELKKLKAALVADSNEAYFDDLRKCIYSASSDKSRLNDGLKNTTIAQREAARTISANQFSRGLADGVKESIKTNEINDLDKSEINHIANDIAGNLHGAEAFHNKNRRAHSLARATETLSAPLPHTKKNGVSFLRPRDSNTVTIVFNYDAKDDDKKLTGDSYAYFHIPGSNEMYGRAQVCTDDTKPMEVMKNGKPVKKWCKLGDIVIDPDTIFHRESDGKYEKYGTTSIIPGRSELEMKFGDYGKSAIEDYKLLGVKAMSQINRAGKGEEPDIERKVAVMCEGEVYKYNGKAPEKDYGKNAVEGMFLDKEKGASIRKDRDGLAKKKIAKFAVGNCGSEAKCESGADTDSEVGTDSEENNDKNISYVELKTLDSNLFSEGRRVKILMGLEGEGNDSKMLDTSYAQISIDSPISVAENGELDGLRMLTAKGVVFSIDSKNTQDEYHLPEIQNLMKKYYKSNDNKAKSQKLKEINEYLQDNIHQFAEIYPTSDGGWNIKSSVIVEVDESKMGEILKDNKGAAKIMKQVKDEHDNTHIIAENNKKDGDALYVNNKFKGVGRLAPSEKVQCVIEVSTLEKEDENILSIIPEKKLAATISHAARIGRKALNGGRE